MTEPNQKSQGPDVHMVSQQVSLPGVELKAVSGEPVDFDVQDMPTAYSGTLRISFKDLEALGFWRLQRTAKAGHLTNVSVEYTQGHLDGAGESSANGQLPIPESAYRRTSATEPGPVGS